MRKTVSEPYRKGVTRLKKIIAAVIGCAAVLTGTGLQIPVSAQTLTKETQNYYASWKETYLRKNPDIAGENQY